MSALNDDEIRAVGRVLQHEAVTRFGRNWRDSTQTNGPSRDELNQILIDYNNGELQSEEAREIIRDLNSSMGLAGQQQLQVYARKLKRGRISRLRTVQKIDCPQETDFTSSSNAQKSTLNKIVSLMVETGHPLYLANDTKNLRSFLNRLTSEGIPHPELIRTLPEVINIEPRSNFSNKFDFTHIDCVTKCSVEMWRNGTGVFRIGEGIALFQNNMAQYLFQAINRNFSDAPEEVAEPQEVFPRVFQRSQDSNPNQPSEAILEGLAMLGGVLHWIHQVNPSDDIIALGSHRTNESFSAIIGPEMPVSVNRLQLETDITTQVRSDDSDVGVHEVKCEKHSDMKNNFARYQLFNPANKVLNRYEEAGDTISELRIAFLVGHWKDGNPDSGIIMDAYVFDFNNNSDISTMRLLRRRRFEFHHC
jgi:hypothetical protein